MKILRLLVLLSLWLGWMGCAHHPPLATVDHVDLDRFMGLWYVQGYTPILVDHEAHNAVEHYRLDGEKIRTTYQFREGGFDGELETMTPVGWVENTSTNAEWRMQFIWPFSAQYLIHYLSDDYARTIIAHPNRKYAWIMNRTPTMEASVYQNLLSRLEREGFDPEIIQRIPQDWSGEQKRIEASDIFAP